MPRKVVLFQPAYAGKVFGPPLGLLSLAAALRNAGFEPVVIDAAVCSDPLRRIERELDDCLCFGVSLLTGPMIRGAVQVARRVKELRPELPVIFGGWHPTLETASTLREPYVDIVVRHQGEATLVEIARRLEAGSSLDLVAGCWFRHNGRIVENPDRPTQLLTDLATPAYDLVDFDAYAKVIGNRKLPYASSIGCPYACHYCTDMVFYHRRFNALSAGQVVEEMVDLAARYQLDEIALIDSNFLVDTHRAMAIARGLVNAGARFHWTYQTSTDLLCRLSDDDVRLLGQSGVSHIGFGTESASEEVLRAMNKWHQHLPDLFETARKCGSAGIRVTFNLIFGYPGETEEQRHQTLLTMARVGEQYPNVRFSPNVFTPFPGIPIWPQLRELGVYEPQTLEEWAEIDLKGNVLPWLRGPVYERFSRSLSYFLLNRGMTSVRHDPRLARWRRKSAQLVSRLLTWRIQRRRYDWPWELWLLAAGNWLNMRRSLLTGERIG